MSGVRVYDGANGAFAHELDVKASACDEGTDEGINQPESDAVDFSQDGGNQCEGDDEEGLLGGGQRYKFTQAGKACGQGRTR